MLESTGHTKHWNQIEEVFNQVEAGTDVLVQTDRMRIDRATVSNRADHTMTVIFQGDRGRMESEAIKLNEIRDLRIYTN